MEKIEKITRILEEVITYQDLKNYIKNNIPLNHYIGFELSGLAHLGTALLTSIKIKDFQECGINTNIFLADWHSWINDKLGGDMENIKNFGVNYFKEVFSATLKSIGAQEVNFILASEFYKKNDHYWEIVIEIAKHTTLARVKRSIDILGREKKENIDFAKLIYPIMQVADIFAGGFNLVHAGMDQRKAHVIARQVAFKIKRGGIYFKEKRLKPIALHQPLLPSLSKPPIWPLDEKNISKVKTELKMSKSKPEGCIFVHDSPQEIKEKIMKAFCPPNSTIYNPVLSIARLIILPLKEIFKVKTQNGSVKTYTDQKSLIQDYQDGLIHPLDLKESVIEDLTQIIYPIYKHFSSGYGKQLKETIISLISR